MAEPAPGEKEVQILRPEAGNRLTLDISSLESILLADDVKDKPVVVVSVAGAYRKGKSFLLGFFSAVYAQRQQDQLATRFECRT